MNKEELIEDVTISGSLDLSGVQDPEGSEEGKKQSTDLTF